MSLTFELDEEKAEANLRKHRVSFEEAKTVFNDPFSITIPDPVHSEGENRYVDIGYSASGLVLIVIYTEREASIRIISCRRATNAERKVYEEDDSRT